MAINHLFSLKSLLYYNSYYCYVRVLLCFVREQCTVRIEYQFGQDICCELLMNGLKMLSNKETCNTTPSCLVLFDEFEGLKAQFREAKFHWSAHQRDKHHVTKLYTLPQPRRFTILNETTSRRNSLHCYFKYKF